MMRFSIGFICLVFSMGSGMANSAPLSENATQKARQFYACAQFFEAGNLNKENQFAGREKALSFLFSTKAASILLGVADKDTAKAIMDAAAADYRKFSADLQNIKEVTERGKKQEEFSESCITAGNVKTEDLPLPGNDPGRFANALKTYECYSFLLKMSQVKQGDLSEKSRRLSNQLLLRATLLVAPTDSENSKELNFAKKVSTLGETEVHAFLKDAIALPREEAREKIRAYQDACFSMAESLPKR